MNSTLQFCEFWFLCFGCVFRPVFSRRSRRLHASVFLLNPFKKRTPRCHRCPKAEAISTQTPEHTQRPASQATSRAQRPESRFAAHENQSPAMASVLLPESRSRATASARHPESRCPQPDPEHRHAPDGHASVAHQSTAARANTARGAQLPELELPPCGNCSSSPCSPGPSRLEPASPCNHHHHRRRTFPECQSSCRRPQPASSI